MELVGRTLFKMKKIRLTQGKVAIVDDGDYVSLNRFKWYASKSIRVNRVEWYAQRNIKLNNGRRTIVRMHREILGTKPGMETDHVDGNGLNNTRKNLRACTRLQNSFNSKKTISNCSSRFKGISFCGGKWNVSIGHKGRFIYLGRYSDEVTAARAYDSAAMKLFGEFAKTNFSEVV